MANGQRILHQMTLNQKEIASLMHGGVTPQERNRLNMLLRSQGYWGGEYEKATGTKVPGQSQPAQPKRPARQVRETTKQPIRPECPRPLPWVRAANDRNQFLPAASVVSLSGDVTVRHSKGNWHKATAGMKLYKGSVIRVQTGNAVIRFQDGATQALGPNFLVVIHGPATPMGPMCPVDVEVHGTPLQEAFDALNGVPDS